MKVWFVVNPHFCHQTFRPFASYHLSLPQPWYSKKRRPEYCIHSSPFLPQSPSTIICIPLPPSIQSKSLHFLPGFPSFFSATNSTEFHPSSPWFHHFGTLMGSKESKKLRQPPGHGSQLWKSSDEPWAKGAYCPQQKIQRMGESVGDVTQFF